MCITEIYITKQNNLNTDIQYPRLMKHSNNNNNNHLTASFPGQPG